MALLQQIIEVTLMAIGVHFLAFVVAFALVAVRDYRRSKHFNIKVTLHDKQNA